MLNKFKERKYKEDWLRSAEAKSKKHPSYTRRTSLFTDELKNGNISLKISKVKLSDEGTYKCFVPELNKHTTVQLVVGASSPPAAEINSTISSRVVLQCESAGWYPEPELLWLDGEGNLLSAGPTETLRGPDDLYTVSSRVTVEKRHSNNITCRVQQRNTNQSRETHIHVPDDFFIIISPSSNPNIAVVTVISVAVVLVLIVAVFFLWKRRRDKFKNQRLNEEEGPEQMKQEKINYESDNSGFKVVVEEGESEPLLTAIEKENDVHGRGEQSHKDKRESQDQFKKETEQNIEVERPEEESNCLSVITEAVSQFTTEQKPHEEEEATGREVETERSEGEGDKTIERVKEDSDLQPSLFTGEQAELEKEAETFHFHRETDTQQERPTESDVGIKQSDAEKKKTKRTNKQEKKKKETQKKKQEKNQREELEVKRQREENQRKLQSETQTEPEKDETEINAQTDKTKQHDLESKKQDKSEAEAQEKHSDKKQEEDTSQKDNMGPTFSNVTERTDLTNQEKIPEGIKEQQVLLKEEKSLNSASLFTDQQTKTDKKTQQAQLTEERQTVSDVKEKQPNVMKKIQKKNVETVITEQQKQQKNKRERSFNQRRKLQSEMKTRREQNETELKTQPDTDRQHCLESIKQDKSEGETQEKPSQGNKLDTVGTTDWKHQEETSEKDNTSPKVSNNVTERTHLKAKRDLSGEENQMKLQSQTQTEEERETELLAQKDQHQQSALKRNQTPRSEMQSEDEPDKKDNQRNERIAEPQRSVEDNMISPGSSKVIAFQRKTENQEKQPAREPEESQEGSREQPEKLRRAESRRAQGEMVNIGTDETQRKDEEKEKLQIYKATTEQQQDINHKILREQPQESISVTERGAECLGGLMEEEPLEADQTCNGNRKNIKRQQFKPERELHEVRQLTTRKAKNQSKSRTQLRKNSTILKENQEKEQKSDQMDDAVIDDPNVIVKLVKLREILHSEINKKEEMQPMDQQ
ncbi:unnamed protein product [Oreochromis niloticus]|nr:unnamed protein product [Mustela putorius furo]